MKYDLKNVIDLLRYLFPNPPVPVRWRRRMLVLGSGDPMPIAPSAKHSLWNQWLRETP